MCTRSCQSIPTEMQEHESDIAERIAAARREAEALKDRIKLRKEALADATCKCLKPV